MIAIPVDVLVATTLAGWLASAAVSVCRAFLPSTFLTQHPRQLALIISAVVAVAALLITGELTNAEDVVAAIGYVLGVAQAVYVIVSRPLGLDDRLARFSKPTADPGADKE